jgi:hypothetical protein
MLTDDELTTRLRDAFHESAPDLRYGGRVPHVRRTGGLAAASVLAAATAVALAPAALEREQAAPPHTVPSPARTTAPQHSVVRTLRLGALRFAYASTNGSGDLLYLVVGSGHGVPPDAEKADIDAAGHAEVWFAHDPADGEPQVYVRPQGSSLVYGILAPGWTREQLTFMLQHPVAAQRDAR